jgi:MipA family protein
MRYAVSAMLVVAGALAVATPAAAQESSSGESALEGDYLTLGIGGVFVPSYDGSDDYVISPLPMVVGSLGGVGISPRAGGLALDFIPDSGEGVHFTLGVNGRVRFNRVSQVKDDVVELLPDLDTAIEVGPTIGVTFPGVFNQYDSLSLTVDGRWDVGGAHGGMVIDPAIAYTTPLSRGIAAQLSVGGEWADDDFMDYYYSIDAGAATVTGLPQFQAGSEFRSIGTQLLVGFDLSGNIEDGGLALFAVGGYSKLLGDAKDSPFTSVRGSSSQWLGGAGIAYTF